MGKIISVIHTSLDGFVADAERQISWIQMNGEIHEFVMELCHGAAGTVYGRTTYEMMDPFWPNVLKQPEQYEAWLVEYARWADKALKVIVSRTIGKVSWQNSRVISDPAEVATIKQEVDGDLLLLGSPTLAGAMFQLGLVDELVVTITPVVLGKGIPYLSERVPLALMETRTFSSGVIGLRYRVERK